MQLRSRSRAQNSHLETRGEEGSRSQHQPQRGENMEIETLGEVQGRGNIEAPNSGRREGKQPMEQPQNDGEEEGSQESIPNLTGKNPHQLNTFIRMQESMLNQAKAFANLHKRNTMLQQQGKKGKQENRGRPRNGERPEAMNRGRPEPMNRGRPEPMNGRCPKPMNGGRPDEEVISSQRVQAEEEERSRRHQQPEGHLG